MHPLMKALREEVQAAFPGELPRRPALRRAMPDRWWLATDLPLFAPERVAEFCSALPGWRFAAADNGWLLLDRDIAVPENTTAGPCAGELACLTALLERHPGAEDDPAALHRLIKAADESPAALAKELRQLHQAWAARLRRHEMLPAALLPWLWMLTEQEKQG